MAITNTKVVDSTSKYIVKSTGVGSETDQILVDAEELDDGTNKSLVSMIECYYLIEGTGTLKIGASGSELIATIHFENCIPTKCCKEPEIPHAIYNSGVTVFPVCPT